MAFTSGAPGVVDRERLIFALDFPSHEEALKLVETLGDSVHFYKLGLQILLAGSYLELAERLASMDKKIMVDLKLFDVPETVNLAVRQLQRTGATFATVHGNDSILEAAVQANDEIQILAVTMLTSLDQGDMEDLGFRVPIEDVVLSRARRALEIGCAGVISSGLEAPALRQANGEKIVIVTPGIRPGINRPQDDQKRTVDVEEAFERGADYIVVGRPIRDAPDPRKAAEEHQQRIARFFESVS